MVFATWSVLIANAEETEAWDRTTRGSKDATYISNAPVATIRLEGTRKVKSPTRKSTLWCFSCRESVLLRCHISLTLGARRGFFSFERGQLRGEAAATSTAKLREEEIWPLFCFFSYTPVSENSTVFEGCMLHFHYCWSSNVNLTPEARWENIPKTKTEGEKRASGRWSPEIRSQIIK